MEGLYFYDPGIEQFSIYTEIVIDISYTKAKRKN